jgi:hypothetical protein
MAVMVNGHEVAYRIIPSEIDLGSRKWRVRSLGGDAQGQHGGLLDLAEVMFYSATQSLDEQKQMNKSHYCPVNS